MSTQLSFHLNVLDRFCITNDVSIPEIVDNLFENGQKRKFTECSTCLVRYS